VTDLKRERLEAEDRGWAELRSLVDPLRPEQLTRDGYYEDWSVKDLLAHLGCWMAEAALILEQIRLGTFDDAPVDVDGLNARWYETWRDQDLRTVWAELHSARARALEEWDRLPEVTDKADEWFRESGEDHYAEHLPRLRSWIEEMRT
jgi:Mycothiol maleylpyruvate isomerase N-terminal domain